MVERYIEVTDEYIKQLEQEMDNLKKINEKHKKLNGELREENKKQKEVIDKAILELASIDGNLSNSQLSDRICNLIYLLKEV